jgi:chromosome segregation ATPase
MPVGNVFISSDRLLNGLLSPIEFEEIDRLYAFTQYANVIDEYKHNLLKLASVEAEYNLHKSKIDSIEILREEIDELHAGSETLSSEIRVLRDECNSKKTDLVKLTDELSILTAKTEMRKKLMELEANMDKIGMEYRNAVDRSQSIIGLLDLHDRSRERLDAIKSLTGPAYEQRNGLVNTIDRSMEYETEMREYTGKLARVEAVRKYTSPTRGIQTFFIELYMNSMVQLANDLLGMMFEGRYRLEKFVINETEFRIPCVGDGLPNDDVSSMSTSEVCMISMILSFTLLLQSSSFYNILRLDEMDGGLDGKNRTNFPTLLDKLMTIMNVSQCVIISHNNEFDMSECDVIQLRRYGGETDDYDMNLIYDFDTEKKPRA